MNKVNVFKRCTRASRAALHLSSSSVIWYTVLFRQNRTDRPTALPLPEEEEDATPLPVQLVDWSHLPDQHVLSGEAQEVLRTAINELPMGLRAAFILRDMEGLSTAECAHIQELTEAACKVRLHRARLRLREQLSTYFGERGRTHPEETL